MCYPMIRGQGNSIDSSTKEMIETHAAENAIIIITIIIRKATTESITQWKNVKSNNDINKLPEQSFSLTI